MGNKTGYWLASSFSLHDIGLDKLYINAYVENCWTFYVKMVIGQVKHGDSLSTTLKSNLPYKKRTQIQLHAKLPDFARYEGCSNSFRPHWEILGIN